MFKVLLPNSCLLRFKKENVHVTFSCWNQTKYQKLKVAPDLAFIFIFNFCVRSGVGWIKFQGKPLTCSQLRHDLVNFVGKLPLWLRKSQGLSISGARMVSLYPGGHVLACSKASKLKLKSFLYACGGLKLMSTWQL